MVSKKFDNYVLYHLSGSDNGIHLTINCFYEDTSVGFIHFYENEVPDPEVLPGGRLQLSFSKDRVTEIVTTIRYEKPLFISIQDSKSVISTLREPVGEQEAD